MTKRPAAVCVGCGKTPEQLHEYSTAYVGDEQVSAEEYVWREEGTLNQENGHFWCTPCYIKAGTPLGKAP